MRENCTYGSEGGEAKAFPTPIRGGAAIAVLLEPDICGSELAREHRPWLKHDLAP